MRSRFFQVASQFQGKISTVKGPASALRLYLRKIDWDIDARGFLLVSAFERLHLAHTSLQEILLQVNLAWQRDFTTLYTSRKLLKGLPDISRLDTSRVLRAFPESDRRQLVRQICGVFQLETQKQKWASDETATGCCIYCGGEDSHDLRMLHCPSFADVRTPYVDLVNKLVSLESTLPTLPVIHVHEHADSHRLIHASEPGRVINDHVMQLCQERAQLGETVDLFTDGSCLNPSMATTRFCAFSCVLDLLKHDDERCHYAEQALVNGKPPPSLQPIFAARLKGLQTINRAELSAAIHALSLPGHLIIHTDSDYVVRAVQRCRIASHADVLQQLNNSDLLVRLWHALRRSEPVEIRKIKAHRNVATLNNPLLRYLAYGNMVADMTANQTCQQLNPEWVSSLKAKHEDVQHAMSDLHQFFFLALDLQKARAQWEAAQSRADNVNVHAHVSSRGELLNFLRTWRPDDGIVFEREDISEWADDFSWGASLANSLVDWISLCVWPREPPSYMPASGVSWLELALSFSFHIRAALPIVREDDLGNELVLFTVDADDVAHHHITLGDMAHTFQSMWSQAILWLGPEKLPVGTRGLNNSLYLQGFAQCTSGFSPRFHFPHQALVCEYVMQHVKDTSDFDTLFRGTWIPSTGNQLHVVDWKKKCQQLKLCRKKRRG